PPSDDGAEASSPGSTFELPSALTGAPSAMFTAAEPEHATFAAATTMTTLLRIAISSRRPGHRWVAVPGARGTMTDRVVAVDWSRRASGSERDPRHVGAERI